MGGDYNSSGGFVHECGNVGCECEWMVVRVGASEGRFSSRSDQ